MSSNDLFFGLLLAVGLFVLHSASTRRHQPQVARIVFEPDASQIEAGGCLIPTLIGLALLLLLLFGSK